MIREFKDEDLPILMAMEKELFVDPWDEEAFAFSTTSPFKMYILEEKNSIIGYLGIWELFDRMEIVNLAIGKLYQHQGYGKELMNYAMNIAKENDYKNITLEVRVDNEAAISLYEQFGFSIWGLKKHYYGDTDGYLMGRGLKEYG